MTGINILFYKIDLESYYSLNPFNEENFEQFTYIQPFLTLKYPLKNMKDQQHTIEIPANLKKDNLLI